MRIIKDEVDQVYKIIHGNGKDSIRVDICEYDNNKEVKRKALFLLNEAALKREFGDRPIWLD